MNIAGVERPLALFAPPINPRDLIRTASSGDTGMPLAGALEPPIPSYRFTTMVARAKSLANSLIALGSSFLSALEKRDAEALNMLRTTQEKAILNLTTLMKQRQLAQTASDGDALAASLLSAQDRLTYYSDLVAGGLSEQELASLLSMADALVFNLLASVMKTASSIGYAIPNAGSPFAMTYGGREIGNVISAAGGVFEIAAMIASYQADKSATMAGYARRNADWAMQAKQAQYDVQQITAQIQSNARQREIAARDLLVHETTIAQNDDMEAFLKSKFTNQELYQWMAAQLSTVFFQTYTLALDLARSAQRAYQFELNTGQTFLNFGYWDSLRRGLTAGESLVLALEQMERAWLTNNTRTLEVQRTISLLQLDAKALLDLQRTGECLFSLPERLFDLDFPGHYCRKIATVSVSIPAVLGPYQNVSATLTQLSNQILIQPAIDGVKFLLGDQTAPVPDARTLRSNWWPNQQIALSKGSNDSGLFELSFNDERYLPFENTGAVSSWRLRMPLATNNFELSTISDVVIQLKYTALDGGEPFRDRVITLPELREVNAGRALFLSQNYSQQWYAFMSDHTNDTSQTLQFQIPPLIVPPHILDAVLLGFYIQLDSTETGSVDAPAFVQFAVPGKTPMDLPLTDSLRAQFTIPPEWGTVTMEEATAAASRMIFTLAATPAFLKKGEFLDQTVLTDISMVFYFRGQVDWKTGMS